MAKDINSRLSPEAEARISFVHSVIPRRRHHYLKYGLSLLVVVLLILSLAWLFSPSSNKAKNHPIKVSMPQVTSLSASIPSGSYTSNFFGLSLKYPTSWAVKDTGQGLMNITSPIYHLVAADNSSVKGQIVMTVQKAGSLPIGLTTGTALAVLDSSSLSYASPSSDQSGQTYLSFVQYSTTNTKGGLDAVYVTGNFGYQKAQIVPPSDLTKIDPLIYVSFNTCKNKQCTLFTPLTIASSSWSSTPLGQVISSIIESFIFA